MQARSVDRRAKLTDATRLGFLATIDGFGTILDVEATRVDFEATGAGFGTLRAGGRIAEGVAGRFCGKVEVDARGTVCENKHAFALQSGWSGQSIALNRP